MVRDKFAFICLSCENVSPEALGPKKAFFVATFGFTFHWTLTQSSIHLSSAYLPFFCVQANVKVSLFVNLQPVAGRILQVYGTWCCRWLCNYWQSLSGPFRPAGGPWLFGFFSLLLWFFQPTQRKGKLHKSEQLNFRRLSGISARSQHESARKYSDAGKIATNWSQMRVRVQFSAWSGSIFDFFWLASLWVSEPREKAWLMAFRGPHC